jgi:hypothetical protein
MLLDKDDADVSLKGSEKLVKNIAFLTILVSLLQLYILKYLSKKKFLVNISVKWIILRKKSKFAVTLNLKKKLFLHSLPELK